MVDRDTRLRTQLWTKVWNGKLQLRRAEQVAARLKIPPLIVATNESALATIRWTMGMTVAWIAWRNLAEVDLLVPRHLAPRGDLPPDPYAPPFPPCALQEFGILEMQIETSDGSSLMGTASRAIRLLWDALAAGRISSVGVDPRGDIRRIEPHEWPYLFLPWHSVEPSDRVVFAEGDTTAYHRVTLLRDDVFRIFGFPDTSPAGSESELRVPVRSSNVASLTTTEQAIHAATSAQWPGGVPGAMKRKTRDRLLADRMRQQGFVGPIPSAVTFRRYFKKLAATEAIKSHSALSSSLRR
jgi:hypothetical protein